MEHFGTTAPCTMYEEKPILDPSGKPVEGLHSAWITLNNPAQYNSYTTEMVKGVIAGFQRAQEARNVVAVVFTGAGNNAFCTGGNTKEYSEYYSQKPTEYNEYMTLFNTMVDSILSGRYRYFRPGRAAPRFCPGRRFFGFPALGFDHRRCDVELRFLRDVERLQNGQKELPQ
jgi:hypothetical protein